jgi:hypothetical protein
MILAMQGMSKNPEPAVKKRRSMAAFWALALLSLCIKENAPIALFFFSCGLFLLRMKKQAVTGVLLSICSFVLINRVLMPHFSGGGGNTTLVLHFGYLGSTNQEILSGIFHHPWVLIRELSKRMTDRTAVTYLFRLFLPMTPFLFLAPLSWSWSWFVALLLALMNMAGVSANRAVGSHYELILIPFLFYGAILGLKRRVPQQPAAILPGAAYENAAKRLNEIRSLERVVLAILLSLVVFGRSPIFYARQFWPTQPEQCIDEALSKIGSRWSVSTQYALYPHLSRRETAVHLESSANLKSDLVIASVLPGIDLWNDDRIPEIVKSIPADRYRPAVNLRSLQIWCEKARCPEFRAPEISEACKHALQ